MSTRYTLGYHQYLGHGDDEDKTMLVDTGSPDGVELQIVSREAKGRTRTTCLLDERMVRKMRGQLTKWLRTYYPHKDEDEDEIDLEDLGGDGA